MNGDIVCIFPPLLAILLALVYKQVIPSLFAGILLGLLLIHGVSFNIIPLFLDQHLIKSINQTDHLYVILFTFLIGGMVRLIQVNGGMEGVMQVLSRHINSQKRALLSTYFLGLFIFFDDYANTLIVGNSMRSITDKFGISREKLAYIVDSTSAPLAAIAFISTWIGAELGYIEESLAGIPVKEGAYSLFLSSLPYSFYPILTLFFVGLIVYTNKDFGPMHNTTPSVQTQQSQAKKGKAYLALIPISVLIFITGFGLVYTGVTTLQSQQQTITLQAVIAQGNAYKALLWGSFSSFLCALLLSLLTIKRFETLLKESYKGFSSMFDPILILVMAWILGGIMQELGTANFISQNISSVIPLIFLPVIVFILSGLTSFSTGSSWGTMALIYPIALPVVWQSLQQHAIAEPELNHLYMTIAAVLGGAVFGDHCSPISDTTILSSAASQCNHINHVRTQIPYAMLTGIISMLLYFLSATFLSPWISLFVGCLLLFYTHRILSTRTL